jgi:peptide/nickel transport system substrate-binding protein
MHAIDRKAIKETMYPGGLARVASSCIPPGYFGHIPMEFPEYAPEKAKKLLAEAGHPGGFDGGEFFCDLQVCPWGEAMLTHFKAVGIRLRLRPMERATLFGGVAEKKYRNVVYLFLGSSGNAATWLESTAITGGVYAHGGYPDIDGLFREQATELDRGKREALLHRIQQMIHERAMFAPVWDFAFLHGVGPRVEESGLGLMKDWGFSAPYEDVKLKGR